MLGGPFALPVIVYRYAYRYSYRYVGLLGICFIPMLTAQGRERREGPHCMPCKYGLIHKAFVVVVRMFAQTQRAEDQFFGTDTEPRVKAG